LEWGITKKESTNIGWWGEIRNDEGSERKWKR